jgi:outer membrane autotransporter protein
MSTFRIIDTKFRILKGGKIGLAMSIAMIGGMLSLGSTSANATTYSASDVGFYTGSSSTTINTDAGGQPAINVAWSTADSRTGTLTINSGDSSGIYVTGSMNSDSVNGYPILSSNSGNGQLAGWSSARDYITTTLTTRNYVDGFNTVINLTNGDTIGSGGIAINVQDDTGGSSVLNLDSADRTINGSIYVDDVNLLGWTTTFNGSVYSNIDMSASTAAVFTNAATSIGAINGAGAFVYLNGNNSLTGIVTAATVSLSGNDITFNDNVTAAVNFTAAGDATMANGADLTGNVSFGNHNATLTLSNGSDITGNVTGTGTDNGTLNFEGSSIVSGDVGLIKEINVGGYTSRVRLNTDSTDTTTVNALNINADLANVEVNGMLTANTVSMGGHYSKLELLDNDSASATVTTANASTGASKSATYSAEGMKGTLNFGTYNATTNVPATATQGKGTLEIGDNVDVTFSTNPANGINAVNANNATLVFAGSSTVGGNVGTSHTSTNTFNQIWAGATDETVTFENDVYVGVDTVTATTAGSLSTASSHNLTTGSGTVNLNGSLYGNLVIGVTTNTPNSIASDGTDYDNYGGGDVAGAWTTGGTVNVAHNENVEGSITTASNGTGTLNFMGSSSYGSTIGTSSAKLAAVTFNSASIGSSTTGFTATINNNVYANTVTIGNGTNSSMTELKDTSLVDATGSYDYAGATNMQVWTGGTVANIGSSVTSLGDALVLSNARDAINFGTSQISGLTSFTTNNGAMSFTVNTQDITGANQAASTSTGSGKVTTTALNMSGDEKIHINYVGSLANNGSYILIDGTSGTGENTTVNSVVVGQYNQNENGNVSDNSFSIDTRIATDNAGDLTVYADRTANSSYTADELYVQKSETVGHFSNNAAMALAAISADGSQTGDMIEVIQKLELDSFGYGNNQENLAVQVQKLAPIVNTSFAQTSIGATKLVTDTVGSRLSDVRGLSSGEAVKDKGVWAKVTGSTASQDKVGQYDGYNLSSGGVVFGIDKELNNGLIIGLAAGYTNTKTEQDDFRDGDKATTNSYQLSAYASKTYDKAYVDGSLSYTKHNTDGERSTAIDRVASYDVDADQLSAKINGGYNFILENKVAITPFASLEYSTIKQNAYKETGAGAINLSVDDVTVNRGAAGLGVKVSKEIKTEKNTYIPEFKLGANKYFGDDNVEVEAQFEQGNKFVTKGADMTDVMYNAGLGLKTKFTEDTSVSLSTDYERSNDGDFQGVNGQLTFRMQF